MRPLIWSRISKKATRLSGNPGHVDFFLLPGGSNENEQMLCCTEWMCTVLYMIMTMYGCTVYDFEYGCTVYDFEIVWMYFEYVWMY